MAQGSLLGTVGLAVVVVTGLATAESMTAANTAGTAQKCPRILRLEKGLTAREEVQEPTPRATRHRDSYTSNLDGSTSPHVNITQ